MPEHKGPENKGIVIGGGTMGADIAAIFAGNGWDVEIVEPNEAMRESLESRVKASAAEIETGKPLGKVRVRAAIGDIDWSGAALVIEAVWEDLDAKRKVFAELEQAAPRDLPLTSNSSGFPTTQIAEGMATASRVFGLHFFMPAHIVPCVELILGERSDPALAEKVGGIMRDLGKKPVLVRKDIPGFLGNRIQAAMIREALALVDAGYASVEDIDTVVRYSFGFRLVAAGPLLQKDISGLTSVNASAKVMYPSLSNASEPSRLLQRIVGEGKSGIRTKEGFYKWDDASIAVTKQRYARAIRKALAILREEDAAAAVRPAGSSAAG
jgi:3-hydroxybutyryl-CoA dehydrogenase